MLGLENIIKNIFKCWYLVRYLFIGNKNNWIKGGMVVRGMGVVGENQRLKNIRYGLLMLIKMGMFISILAKVEMGSGINLFCTIIKINSKSMALCHLLSNFSMTFTKLSYKSSNRPHQSPTHVNQEILSIHHYFTIMSLKITQSNFIQILSSIKLTLIKYVDNLYKSMFCIWKKDVYGIKFGKFNNMQGKVEIRCCREGSNKRGVVRQKNRKEVNNIGEERSEERMKQLQKQM